MADYAKNTTVTVDRSRSEIERTLERFGADEFMYGYDRTRALVQFTAQGRRVRFILVLPGKDEERFHTTLTGRARTATAALEAWEQSCRESWRALAAVIKAKLVAVDTGIVGFEEEFAAHIVLPDGTSVGEWLIPQIRRAYEVNQMPPMLQITPPKEQP